MILVDANRNPPQDGDSHAWLGRGVVNICARLENAVGFARSIAQVHGALAHRLLELSIRVGTSRNAFCQRAVTQSELGRDIWRIRKISVAENIVVEAFATKHLADEFAIIIWASEWRCSGIRD